MEKSAIKLNAGYDRNGNPRRVYVIIGENGENVIKAIDEGSVGIQALWKYHDGEFMGYYPVEFSTTPKEYRELLKNYGNEKR